jgi:hypothetical protein
MRLLLALALAVAAGAAERARAAATQPGEALAVIVHPTSKLADVARRDLAALFLRRRASWPDGRAVLLLNWPPLSEQRLRFDSAILGMTADEVAAYWIDRRIRGHGSPPRSVGSGPLIASIVARNREALAYVPLSSVTRHVRVLRIDGLAPGHPRYPLRKAVPK